MLRIVANPAGGSAPDQPAVDLAAHFPDADILEIIDGESPADAIERAVNGATTLGVVGGDGTVACAAEAAIAAGIPLLVIPGGTFNHFAHDLDLETVEDAAEAWAASRTATIDTARIAGRPFINNASIGAYAQMVDLRNRLASWLGKRVSLLVAMVLMVWRAEPVVAAVDGKRRRLWLAFFGNGHYPTELAPRADRTTLAAGTLDVRLVHADRRMSRLRFTAAALAGRLDRCSVYDRWTATAVDVDIQSSDRRLAAEGEPFDGPATFRVECHPKSLTVHHGPRFTTALDATQHSDRQLAEGVVEAVGEG